MGDPSPPPRLIVSRACFGDRRLSRGPLGGDGGPRCPRTITVVPGLGEKNFVEVEGEIF